MRILVGYNMQVGHMEWLAATPLAALQRAGQLDHAGASGVTFADEAGLSISREELTKLANGSRSPD